MKWEFDALWQKAKRYAHRAHGAPANDADFGFFSALSLEFLAKAALAHVHPALLAKPDDDGVSLLHALGFDTRAQPKTVEMKTVYLRLMRAVPDFSKTLMEGCIDPCQIRGLEDAQKAGAKVVERLTNGEISLEASERLMRVIALAAFTGARVLLGKRNLPSRDSRKRLLRL